MTRTRTRTCPACGGPLEENVHRKFLKENGEPRLVAEASTWVCDWCDYESYA